MDDARVDCILSPAARAALDDLGRTEDLTFSPGGRRLAIAGFKGNRIAVFDVAVAGGADGPAVALGDVAELEASTLSYPHGLCFLDEDTLAVANRGGGLQVYAVPRGDARGVRRRVEPSCTITGGADAPIRTPGSVACHPLGPDERELLVCQNSAHVVSRHVLDRRRGWASTRDEVLLAQGLDIPDGVCISADGAWIAISNHNSHEAFVYRRTPALGPRSAPDGVLRNLICPHGLRFTRDRRTLLVADAHARYVNVYESGDGDWSGVRDPSRMFPVLDAATYYRGRVNPQEGGPKGIDLDSEGCVLACTTEHQTLAFFDLEVLCRRAARPESRLKRRVAWRLAHAIHRRRPKVYGWLRPFWL
jgi:sugar lactone lactonase YvrE